ncbi:type II toxin-antitoxin system Phd/YefM family antitoxin [Paenibacillus taichungensis]
MPIIRPVTDLRNNFTEISKIVHEKNEPVFLTKNGHGDMVLMSLEHYEEIEVLLKLKEAEIEAFTSDLRLSHEEVMGALREQIRNGGKDKDVP